MVILCLALAFCGICGGESNTQPQFPHMFYGTATITGSPAPEGYTITTAVDGAANGMIIVSPAGIFGGEGALDQKLIVQGDFQASTSRITFTVEGSPALCREYGSGEGWQESYPFTPGAVTNLELNVGEVALLADFSVNRPDGYAPHTAQFADQSTGSHDQWLWNFGDGKTSTEQNPSHTYTTAGTYTVSLTVISGPLTNVRTKSNYITVFAQGSPSGGGGGGGGGGSGTVITSGQTATTTMTGTLTPTPTVTRISAGNLLLGTDNTTTREVTIAATDTIGSLAIGKGVAPVDSTGAPLSTISLSALPAGTIPPKSPCSAAPYQYEIAPAGVRFTSGVTLVLSFNETTWAGLDKEGASLARYNTTDGSWEKIATSMDPGSRTMKAAITRGGTYVLCLDEGAQPLPTTEPPVTPVATGSPGFSLGIIALASLLIIVVVGVIAYLISTRTTNDGSPPEGGQ